MNRRYKLSHSEIKKKLKNKCLSQGVVTNVEIFQWYKHSFVVIIGTNCYEDLLLKFLQDVCIRST